MREASTEAFKAKMAAAKESSHARHVQMAAANEAINAWLGSAPSMISQPSPKTIVSSPTAAGMADHVAPAKLQIKEVCDRQDAHLETTMTEFRSFADALDHCQPSTPTSFELIKGEDTDDEDKDFRIVLLIGDANNTIKEIAVVFAPNPHQPYAGAMVPLLGGERSLSTPSVLPAFELAPAV